MPLVSGLAENDLALTAVQLPTFGFGGVSEFSSYCFHPLILLCYQLHLFLGRCLLGHTKAMGASHVITLLSCRLFYYPSSFFHAQLLLSFQRMANAAFNVTQILERSNERRSELCEVTYADFRTGVLERRTLPNSLDAQLIAQSIAQLSKKDCYIQKHYIQSSGGLT